MEQNKNHFVRTGLLILLGAFVGRLIVSPILVAEWYTYYREGAGWCDFICGVAGIVLGFLVELALRVRLPVPRFSLRTMLIGVAVLAVPMAWVGYQLNWIRERRAALRDPATVVQWGGKSYKKSFDAPWHLRIFGEQGEHRLACHPENIDRIKRLFPETTVVHPDDRLAP